MVGARGSRARRRAADGGTGPAGDRGGAVLDELHRRWTETEAALAPQDKSFADAVAGYVDATLDRPDWATLVVWRALGDAPGDCAELAAAQRVRTRLERIRRRQSAGEITDALDAELILLLAYAVVLAPIALRDVVEEIFAVDGFPEEYRRTWVEQLAKAVTPAQRDGRAAVNAGSSA